MIIIVIVLIGCNRLIYIKVNKCRFFKYKFLKKNKCIGVCFIFDYYFCVNEFFKLIVNKKKFIS